MNDDNNPEADSGSSLMRRVAAPSGRELVNGRPVAKLERAMTLRAAALLNVSTGPLLIPDVPKVCLRSPVVAAYLWATYPCASPPSQDVDEIVYGRGGEAAHNPRALGLQQPTASIKAVQRVGGGIVQPSPQARGKVRAVKADGGTSAASEAASGSTSGADGAQSSSGVAAPPAATTAQPAQGGDSGGTGTPAAQVTSGHGRGKTEVEQGMAPAKGEATNVKMVHAATAFMQAGTRGPAIKPLSVKPPSVKHPSKWATVLDRLVPCLAHTRQSKLCNNSSPISTAPLCCACAEATTKDRDWLTLCAPWRPKCEVSLT